MKDVNNIEAIIFDLDGTIYNKKWLKLFFSLSYIFNLSILLSYLKIRKQNIGIDCETKEKFNAKIIEEFSKSTSMSHEKCEIFIEKFMQKFISVLDKKYKPNNDIIEVINYYHNKSVKIVCLSDYSMAKERLLALNVDITKFTLIKSSEDYGALKPAKSPFIKIAEELNIEPSKIIVVGDRDDTDGEGARRCNMEFVKYPEQFDVLTKTIIDE